MIYDYLRKQIDLAKPAEVNKILQEAEIDLGNLRLDFDKVWTWCLGCKDWAKRSEAYEDYIDSSIAGFRGYQTSRPVLRCCKCHSLWKYLD